MLQICASILAHTYIRMIPQAIAEDLAWVATYIHNYMHVSTLIAVIDQHANLFSGRHS